MGLPQMDERLGQDRIYHYGEYRKLQEKYGPVGSPRGGKRGLVMFPRVRKHPKNAIRLLPYKLVTTLALTIAVSGIIALSFFRADMVRLAYAEQDLGAARLGQTIYEAEGSVMSAEAEVVSGVTPAASAVVYPERVNCVVRTNIPKSSGKTLVEELYPLSSEIITVEP